MLVEWTAALMFVAAPTTVISVSNLEQSLPEIKQTMTWASSANPQWAPRRANQFVELLGIDFFDVRGWADLGLDPKRMAYVWNLSEDRATVIELAVSDGKKIDGHIRKLLESNLKAQKIIDRSGFWIEPRAGQFLAAVRVKNRLFLQTNRRSGSFTGDGPLAILSQLLTGKAPPEAKKPKPIYFRDDRLEPVRRVMNHRKPKVSAAKRKRTSSVWMHHLDKAHTHAFGPIKLNKSGIEFDLVMKGPRYLRSEITSTLKPKAKSRRVFDTSAINKVGGEVQAHFTPTAMRTWASEHGISVDVSKVWTGEFHVVLMESGALLAGVPIRKEATAIMREALSKELRRFDAQLKQLKLEAYRGEELWLMWWGDVSEKSMKKLTLRSKPKYGPSLSLRFNPPRLLAGFKKRSAARDQMRIPAGKLLLFELVAGELMTRSRFVGAEIVVSPKKAEMSIKLQY